MTRQDYNGMDALVNATYINLHSFAKRNDNTIILNGFDVKNKEHLFILEVAYTARKLNGFKIKIVGNLFRLIWLNFKHRKNENPVGYLSKRKYYKKNMFIADVPNTVDALLDYMRPTLEREVKVPRVNFGIIYDEYYADRYSKSRKEEYNED